MSNAKYIAKMLVALAITAPLFAACASGHASAPTAPTTPTHSSTQPPPATTPNFTPPAPPPPTTVDQPIGNGDAVSGTVSWPDGTPAAGVRIEFFPNGAPFAGAIDAGVSVVTGPHGEYALTGCGCTAMVGYFELPSSGGPNADGQHGGNECSIILQAAPQGAVTGVSANPGDTLDWQLYDMPCARDYFLPEQLQSTLVSLQADPGTFSGGTWQDARLRAEGLPDPSPQRTGACAPDAPFNPNCPI